MYKTRYDISWQGSVLWAAVLFPFVLLAYGYSLAFDPLKRRAGMMTLLCNRKCRS